MPKKYTNNLIKCSACLRGNNFLIKVVQQDKKYYYLTQCPKCNHHEEVKVITSKEALRYLPETDTGPN